MASEVGPAHSHRGPGPSRNKEQLPPPAYLIGLSLALPERHRSLQTQRRIVPSDPRAGEAMAGQPELCLLRDQHSASLSVWILEARRPRGLWLCPAGPTCRRWDIQQQGRCWNHFSNQCLVYYHFVNSGWGEGRDNLFLNKVGDVTLDLLAVQKEAH